LINLAIALQGVLDFEFFEVPNKEVFTALISRAPATITKCLQAFNHFFVVGVIDEISIIKQYSKAGTDAISITKVNHVHVGFFIDFIGCKIFQSIAKTVSFSLKR
jgi:hypothetical protein